MRTMLIIALALGATTVADARSRSTRGSEQFERRPLTAREKSVTYSGCNEVRRLGRAPLRRGEPGYRSWMDGDDDGLACEPIRN